MSSLLQLAAGDATAELAPVAGGAIASFAWRGRPVLRATPRSAVLAGDVRQTACYPLVPYSNRIRQARLRFTARDYQLAHNFGDHPHSIHGAGWQRPWSVDHATASSALLSLTHAATGDGALAWPWPFVASQSIALSARNGTGATLSVTLRIHNPGSAPFPFGLGWHPFFPKREASALSFAARSVWLTDPTQLPAQEVAVPVAWDFTRRRQLTDTVVDNVFTGWDGVLRLADRGEGFDTVLSADTACSYLVFYAPPGRDFIALEPVTHMTDAFNRAASGDGATGMRVLAPGTGFACTMRIAVVSVGD